MATPKWLVIARNEYRVFTSRIRKIRPYFPYLAVGLLAVYVVFMAPAIINPLIDDVIVFRSLNKVDLQKIVEIEVKEVQERLKEKNIEITLDKVAKDFLITKGFDKTFGARPLKRTIQRYLENPLAEEILSGAFKEGTKIKVTHLKDKEELVFKTGK